ncbi:hypothetical protein [Oryza sativa Japonica Group]|uniref:Uncharacterized protein n=2 Tax=Oryza sativa subsp. japonica TaxID=39947 RepID=Q1EHT0_ORYSJ|nr:hypothetical protein [Oryza sativa Japonica Group]BAE95825.1 hypothetical protein [Oryza sativa Japonica Group]
MNSGRRAAAPKGCWRQAAGDGARVPPSSTQRLPTTTSRVAAGRHDSDRRARPRTTGTTLLDTLQLHHLMPLVQHEQPSLRGSWLADMVATTALSPLFGCHSSSSQSHPFPLYLDAVTEHHE